MLCNYKLRLQNKVAFKTGTYVAEDTNYVLVEMCLTNFMIIENGILLSTSSIFVEMATNVAKKMDKDFENETMLSLDTVKDVLEKKNL